MAEDIDILELLDECLAQARRATPGEVLLGTRKHGSGTSYEFGTEGMWPNHDYAELSDNFMDQGHYPVGEQPANAYLYVAAANLIKRHGKALRAAFLLKSVLPSLFREWSRRSPEGRRCAKELGVFVTNPEFVEMPSIENPDRVAMRFAVSKLRRYDPVLNDIMRQIDPDAPPMATMTSAEGGLYFSVEDVLALINRKV